MISISQFKKQINFAGYIAKYTGGLKPTGGGRWYVGYCPFCQNGQPGKGRACFWVDNQRGMCNCYKPKCKADKPMDIINFVARLDGISNQAAIEKLCNQ